ncbi:hypothetical protein ACFRMQ_23810 [Kitasatospora sp. NPDC056783]|uniref:hypothetical protein n=1 Tax=Kitasatospora sp. NPDC056783 TaxID=3345943 RepID=UPI0036785974
MSGTARADASHAEVWASHAAEPAVLAFPAAIRQCLGVLAFAEREALSAHIAKIWAILARAHARHGKIPATPTSPIMTLSKTEGWSGWPPIDISPME